MSFPEPTIQKDDRIGTWPVIIPTGSSSNGTWIPNDFQDAVLLHILKNAVSNLSPSLILAIQGGQGEGKSFQTREICSRMGTYIIPVSGSLLSGSFEREAVDTLQKAYIYASLVRENTNRLTILLIDDFDLSVASTFADRKYTVNSQLLTGFLMNLADDPTRCGDRRTHRIPIIVTGNNFSALHSPLMRHGRMKFYEWKPTIEQKRNVVEVILEPLLIASEVNKIGELIEEHADQPVSFFAALKEDLVDRHILSIINSEQSVSISSVQKAISLSMKSHTLDQLREAAIERSALVSKNYLSKE